MDAERRRSHPGVASQGEASLARRGGELGERGVGFEQILACRLDAAGVVGVDTAADQRTVGSTDRALDHVAHVRVGGWAQRVEHGGTVEPRTMEDSVRRQQVEVRSEGEIGGEALDVGDGGAARIDQACGAGASSLPREQRPYQGAVEIEEKGVIERGEQAQVPGQGQDPLAHRNPGQDVIHETRGGLRHASTAATGTESPAAAGQTDEARAAAGVAREALKTPCHDSTTQVGAQLGADESGERTALGVEIGQELLEMAPKDGVQDRALGVPPAPGRAGRGRGDIGRLPYAGDRSHGAVSSKRRTGLVQPDERQVAAGLPAIATSSDPGGVSSHATGAVAQTDRRRRRRQLPAYEVRYPRAPTASFEPAALVEAERISRQSIALTRSSSPSAGVSQSVGSPPSWPPGSRGRVASSAPL